VRVSSPPSCCLAPSEFGREGTQFVTITTTTVCGLQRFSIEARRLRLRSWSAPSSGPCRRVLSRSLGQQQPPCCPYSPTTPPCFAPHNLHDSQLWLQMLHGRLISTVGLLMLHSRWTASSYYSIHSLVHQPHALRRPCFCYHLNFGGRNIP
jgi:hypothetical protein